MEELPTTGSSTNTSRRRRFPHSSALFLFCLQLSGMMMMGAVVRVEGLGINYGQIANNLPSPDKVVGLVKSIGATKVKLYDADPKVLKAFANTGIEFMVCLGNEDMAEMGRDPKAALNWVRKNVQAYLPGTNITTVLIGNEVLTFNDTALTTSLMPAMQNIHAALQSAGLDRQVGVTTAHNLAVLDTSYPPSAGAFRSDLRPCLSQILNFHAKTGSPFLINAYPYFAYKASPKQVPLDYVLFQSTSSTNSNQGGGGGGMVDPATNLRYDNMLFAQVDAVYAAIAALNPKNKQAIQVQVSETGWPSKGDEDEAGATPDNAKKYNGNLMKLISQGRGTPMRPSSDLNIFVFALFNENMKPGPTSERNYGLFKPDGTPAYSLGFPTLQAVGNTTTPSPTTTSSPQSGSGSGSSSTGYLSISLATQGKYPRVGTSLFVSALLAMMLVALD